MEGKCPIHNVIDHSQEKSFSEVPRDAKFRDYCKSIPGYEKLEVLKIINLEILKNLSTEKRKFIWKYFPSILTVSSPEEINSFRDDNINSPEPKNGDYAEVFFAYGNELVFIWDFDRKGWFVQDLTYSPFKEIKIEDNDILGYLKNYAFNPKVNKLLGKRVKSWISGGFQEKTGFDVEKYINVLLMTIEKNS